ncbi:hypothetical protein [Seonamhaeicola aphaedonensis]|uniref:Lipoprotein n=1 Tax=Seonamhaeicola aphaedonensis TaxID=1461338 RepID=A0A3D9H8Z9_9FLAO|nr:hypothetical protein [Seonamhaeicola aphaedonensis]RED45641.1 hypothetical protein DFQ02_10819 [Seonamhaeicola aphaedonensis]
MRAINRGIFHLPCFGILMFLLIFSCKKSTNITALPEYRFFNLDQYNWKSKRVNQFVNDINYTATEVPLQYYLLKHHPNDHRKVDSLSKVNAEERIVEVEFQHVKKTDLLLSEHTNKTYEDAVKYMAFNMERDFTVVTTSNDTIPCSGFHFERNFKLAPFKRLLLYFNDIPANDNIKLVYQDHLFGNGIIKFNLKDIPLKL